jgi:hypothetical protein
MHLSKVNVALDHRITNGSEYGWQCYGPNARYMDYESEFAHVSVIFDKSDQTIYSAEVSIKPEAWPTDARPYRWLNPKFKDAMYGEALDRKVNPNQAWDETEWIDLEVEEDFLEKAVAMFNGNSWDTRITVALDLDDDLILELAIQAHRRDITLNEMVEIILREAIELEHNRKTT